MAVVTLKPAPLVKSGELTREFVEAYASAADDPAWMVARRLEALRVFRDTPAPQRSDELWRRVDLSAFKLDQVLATIQLPTGDQALDDDARRFLDPFIYANAPGVVAHVNGAPVVSHLDEYLHAQGVIFTDLLSASYQHADWLENHLMTECVKLTDAYFAALHGVFMRGGVVLRVPKGVRIEQPLRAATWMSADQRAGFNHTLIVLEEGAQATLIEEFASPSHGQPTHGQPAQVFYNGAVEIVLGKDAQLDYVSIQDWGRNVWNFTNERAHLHAGATLHWVAGGLGSRYTKSAIEADLLGEGGTALLSGVFFADGKQQLHYDTQQNHIAPACKSDLLYKNALRDEARTVWRGNIRVFPGAQKTDAYQANRNLQLSSKSRADSIPGLEIEADDVRCTHGSTVGRLEEEPMFYLRSRGIPEVEARRLIVEGFFAPVIERIPLEETRERLLAEIARKIG
ncbi:MAG: Fe-S cluster assembly protein SufD [Anaerolineae bacterium]|nr:Fe-S cluster assembly protein SufD [Thermoflexales bacterium]MDW8406193.1 Fe-S cluster assembly protein SufD [Anaerolineae bacterium]